MSDQQGFLDAIIAQPDDDSLRLIYADWLDEHGDADRAEFIRVQCELARLSEEDDRRPALDDREHELLGRHETEWLGELPAYLPEWRFERGFLTFLRTNSQTLLDHGRALFDLHPITRLRIERPDVYELGPIDKLAQEPWLERVENLDTEVFPPVLTSAHLQRVQSLRLTSVVGPDPEVLDFLADCPSLSRLRSLDCRGLLRGDFVSALLDILKRSSVTGLDLGGCEMLAKKLKSLLRTPFARFLTTLRIAENWLVQMLGKRSANCRPGTNFGNWMCRERPLPPRDCPLCSKHQTWIG